MTILFQPDRGHLILTKPAEPTEKELKLPDHLTKSKVKIWDVVASNPGNVHQVGEKIILTDGAKVFTISLPTTEGSMEFCTVDDDWVFGKVEDVAI